MNEDHGPYGLHREDRDGNAGEGPRVGASQFEREPEAVPPRLRLQRQVVARV